MTGVPIDSNVGGYFGPYLKFGGWDALEVQGKLEEAAGQYREVIRSEPKTAIVYVSLGAVLEKQGKTGEAEVQYREALKIDTNAGEARSRLNAVLQRRKK